MKFLNNITVSPSTKILETTNDYYINHVEYDKNTMNPTAFKVFNDLGMSDSICFNQTLAPYYEQKYFTGLRSQNILQDNQNPNICYASNYHTVKDTSYTSGSLNNKFQITICNKKDKFYNQSYNDTSVSSSWGVNFTKWLGQNDTHLYVSIVENNHSNPPDNISYPISTKILAIPKQLITNINLGFNDSTMTMQTIKKSNGDIKVLKETDTDIYTVSEVNSYQYEFGKIMKSNNTYQVINTFNIQDERLYVDTTSSGVSPDFVKINENEFACYISGRREIGDSTGIYEDIIQKAIINTQDETVEIKNITLNTLPFFAHKFGHYYNQIFYMEKNEKKYLVTSVNTFYNSTTKLNAEDKIISIYELNETEPDNITGILVDSITANQLSGDFLGLLFNKKLNSFILMTTITSYIANINFLTKKTELRNLSILPRAIAIDLVGNYWILDNYTQVFLFSKNSISEVLLEKPKDIPVYEGSPIPINIKVAAINYEGNYIQTQVRLNIDGGAVFTDDLSKVKIVDTLDSGFLDIGITINNAGAIRIIPEILF